MKTQMNATFYLGLHCLRKVPIYQYQVADETVHEPLPVSTVKPVLSNHSKKDQKLVFKTNYRLMQVKSIAECFPWSKVLQNAPREAFCNTFDLHLATICREHICFFYF